MISFSDHVAWQFLGREAVIIDLRSGVSLGLNQTGSFIWSRLPHESPDDIGATIARRYGLDVEAVVADVHRFVGHLRERQLVVER